MVGDGTSRFMAPPVSLTRGEDAGMAGQKLSEALEVPHVHTHHSIVLCNKLLFENDYPGDAAKF